MTKCTYCRRPSEFDTVKVNFGYGSKFDELAGIKIVFCSDVCFARWVHDNFSSDVMNANIKETVAELKKIGPCDCGYCPVCMLSG